MESYIEQRAEFLETFNAKDIVGIKVLTSSGEMIGRVSEVRLNNSSKNLEGLVVKGQKLQTPTYICTKYIKKIAKDAIILAIDPAILYWGHKVISCDGKVFGKVMKIERVGKTNNITI